MSATRPVPGVPHPDPAPGPVLYFDDPPIDPRSDSRGLGPINSRMLELFAPQAAIVNLMRLRPGQILYRPDGPAYYTMLGSLPGAMVRAAGRVSRPLTIALESALIGMTRRPGIAPQRHLFAPVGSDLGSIHRALLVARRTGARLLLYLVDDPIEPDRGRRSAGARRRHHWLTRMLAECATVFGITRPLCDLLRTAHGVDARFLPLPYLYDPAIMPRATKNQIIYVGSVNQIYARELDYWIGLLRDRGFFTRGGELVVTGEIAEQPGVVRRQYPTRAALEQEIADSRASLLPISSRESQLCFSSFPSKTLDYLAFSRLVLASAPAGSVVADFFAATGLRYCFPEGQVPIGELDRLLLSQEDHLAAYRTVLANEFSGDRFVATVRGEQRGGG